MILIYRPSACAFLIRLALVGGLSLLRRRLFVLWVLMEVGVVLFIGMLAREVYRRAESSAKFFLSQVFVGVGLFFILQCRG